MNAIYFTMFNREPLRGSLEKNRHLTPGSRCAPTGGYSPKALRAFDMIPHFPLVVTAHQLGILRAFARNKLVENNGKHVNKQLATEEGETP